MNYRQALNEIIVSLRDKDIAVFSTGRISREAFFLRDRPANFYMLGSMGMAISFSLGIGITYSSRKVIVIDGDGAAFMNLGGLAMAGCSQVKNIIHIVLDNGVYASTGGQSCISSRLDLCAFARAAGYRRVKTAKNRLSLRTFLKSVKSSSGPQFLRVKINREEGIWPDRVTLTPEQIAGRLRSFLQNGKRR